MLLRSWIWVGHSHEITEITVCSCKYDPGGVTERLGSCSTGISISAKARVDYSLTSDGLLMLELCYDELLISVVSLY